MCTKIKSILFNLTAITMIMATSGKSIESSSQADMWQSNGCSDADQVTEPEPLPPSTPQPPIQDGLQTIQLLSGNTNHIVFEVPMAELVGSSYPDYEAELVTSRRCVHVHWTSAGLISYWTTDMTGDSGCDLDDDIDDDLDSASEDHEQQHVQTKSDSRLSAPLLPPQLPTEV